MPQYQPFLLRIGEARSGEYPVIAEFEGQVREGSIPAGLPLLDKDEIRQAQTWLERGLLDSPYAQEFGDRLFRTLFAPPIDVFFREAYERAAAEGGLRVVLATPLPEALAAIPWELLYDRAGGLGYLARSNQCPLVRLYSAGALSNPPVTESPLRILVVWASPSDQARLSAQPEVKEIVAALSRGDNPLARLRAARAEVAGAGGWPAALKRMRKRTQIEVLVHATRLALEQRLAAARGQGKPFHAIHFIGHGQASETGAVILLEKADGTSDPAPAEEFAEMAFTRALNLVVLNACETASATGFLRSVAHALLARGVPVVVGMQVPVLDQAAVDFAGAFYTAFAAGEPVESALATARRLITRANRSAAADWSIPAVYMSTAAGLTLDLPVPPFRLPLPLHLGWAALIGFVALMGIITTLLAVPDTAREVRTRVPVIRCWWPYPMEETADKFNVVMTPFTHLTAQGRLDRDGAGNALARQLFGLFRANVDGLKLGETLELELRGPGEGCALPGATPDERARAAEALAEDVNAQIILYGVITGTGKDSLFLPEFHVAYKGFEQGAEITGPFDMGRKIGVQLPITPDPLRDPNHPAAARTRGLSRLVVGLAAYARDDYREAEGYFREAAENSDLLPDEGQEIAYLFLGNAYLRLAEKESDSGLLDDARTNYETALDLATRTKQPGARPQLGLANVIYALALGDLKERSIYNVQPALLDEAETAYKAVLGMEAPAGAQVPLKVAYGLGQIYLLRYMIYGGDWLAKAEMQFTQVTEAHKAAEKRKDDQARAVLQPLAAEAYAGLGTAANWRKEPEKAIALYEQAAEIASPRRQVIHYLTAGDICVQSGKIECAQVDYDKAEGIAHDVVHDWALVEKVRERKNKLTAGQ
jgi:tetratricopeptide (TPR) repeat protein